MKKKSSFFFRKKWISLALFVVVASTIYIGQSTFFNDVERSYAAALTSTNVEPASLIKSTTGTATVSFTTTTSIPSDGKIKITFGAGFDLTGVGGGAGTCSTMDGNFSTAVSGQVVTITRSFGTNQSGAAETCTIDTVKNSGSTGSTGTYTIQTTDSADAQLDVDSAVSADTIANPDALSSTNVQPASLIKSTTGTTTVSFTTAATVNSDWKIKVTFGAGYDLTGIGTVTCSTMDGNFSGSVSGQAVTITRSFGTNQSAAAETCTIDTVKNSGSTGTTGTYSIEVLDTLNIVRQQDTAVAADTIANPDTLTSTNVQPANLGAAKVSLVTVTFTTASAVANNSKIKVTFPAGFDVSGVNNAACSTMDGNFSAGVSGQAVTITRSFGTSESAAAESCTINAAIGDVIRNPSATGSTGTYSIQILDNLDIARQEDTAVSADTITASLTSTNVEPASLVAGASGNVTVSFTSTDEVKDNGKIKVTFPSGFTLNNGGSTAVSAGSGLSNGMTTGGNLAISITGQVVTLTGNGGGAVTGIAASTAVSLTLSNIKNPTISGSAGTYTIQTTDSSNVVLNAADAVTADTITAGALSSTNVAPATLVAGASGTTTVTFTTANAIAATGKIKVTFGSGFNVASASGATCSTMDGSFATAVSGQVVTITRSAGSSQSAAAESCTIGSIVNPAVSGTTGTYTITTTDSSDVTVDTDTAVAADSITAGALTSTNVEPASLVASASGNVTVTFTMANPLPANGKVKVTFGAGFNVASASGGTCSTMDGGFSTSVSAQVVTITRNNAGTSEAAGAQTCTLSNITNPSSAGSTGTYTITTTDTSDASIDTDTAVTADTITASGAGALTSTNVEPASLVAGAVGNIVVSFTTTGAVANNGKIKITLPSGFAINSGASSAVTAGGTINSTAYTTISVSSQTITLTGNGAGTGIGASGSASITISQIKNPTVSGSTGTYIIRTTNSADTVIDEKTDVTADTITVGALTSTNVEPASLVASASGNVTITFTMANPLPANGKVKVTFGAGFNVASASGGTCSTMDGGFSTAVAAQVVTITRNNAGTEEAAGAQTCTLGSITNPSSGGSTGTYTIRTNNTSDAVIDEDTAVTADTITGGTGSLSSPNVQPASLIAGEGSTVTVSFTTQNAIPITGKIKVTFGSGFNVSGASGGTCSTMNGSFATSIAGQVVTITRSGGDSQTAAAESCTIGSIVNSQVSGSTGTYTIRTTDSSDSSIDENTSVTADTIAAATLGSTSVALSSLVVNSTAVATINFTTKNPLANNDKIKITFPSDLNVASASSGTCSTMGGSFSTSVSSQVVTITRSGGSSETIGAETCTLQGIGTPTSPVTTGTFTIQTTTSGDAVRDQDTAVPGVVIQGGGSSASKGSTQQSSTSQLYGAPEAPAPPPAPVLTPLQIQALEIQKLREKIQVIPEKKEEVKVEKVEEMERKEEKKEIPIVKKPKLLSKLEDLRIKLQEKIVLIPKEEIDEKKVQLGEERKELEKNFEEKLAKASLLEKVKIQKEYQEEKKSIEFQEKEIKVATLLAEKPIGELKAEEVQEVKVVLESQEDKARGDAKEKLEQADSKKERIELKKELRRQLKEIRKTKRKLKILERDEE